MVNSLKHEKPAKGCFDIQARGPKIARNRYLPGLPNSWCQPCPRTVSGPSSLIRSAKYLAHFFKHHVSDCVQQCNSIGCCLSRQRCKSGLHTNISIHIQSRPVTSLGYQEGRRVFWGAKKFLTCPIVLNYVQDNFLGGGQ